jgi:hypothetical protein
MARHACVHGQGDNIAIMNITMSFNATALTRLSSSAPGMVGDISSDPTGDTAAMIEFAAICTAWRA